MEKKKEEVWQIVYPHSAGIDVGSRFHIVAVGQSDDQVRKFGINTDDHNLMIDFLKVHQITHVAMESTGSYFQTLFLALQEAGFKVSLVHGSHTKGIGGQKTDVKDCKWIQKLFTYGFLKSCFLPSNATMEIRTLNRHRNNLIDESSRLLNRIGQCMRQMNIRLDVAINDLGGKTGQSIIQAIVEGQRDGNKLAILADSRIRKSHQALAQYLQGRWNDNQLYILKDLHQAYQYVRNRIENCDQQMKNCFDQIIESQGAEEAGKINLTKKQKSRNSSSLNVCTTSYQYYGVDLMEIECVSEATVMSLLAEVGRDIFKFSTASKFVSWLRLAPNNKKTGGKIISSKTPQTTNKFTLTLRNAANTISRKKTGYLLHFFQKIAYKKGRGAAITATARKMAVIIWNMITKKQPYKPIDMDQYKLKKRQRTLKTINKLIKHMEINTDELIIGSQRLAGS